MSTTLMVCHICGGVKAVPGQTASGRRCTCTAGGGSGVSTATETGESPANGSSVSGFPSSSASGVSKICSVCGVDVVDKKRMKDSTTGRYWCYDCFIAEQRKKHPGMTMTCPHCHREYPPLKMVKHKDVYWCEPCHEQMLGRKGKAAVNNVEQAGAAGVQALSHDGADATNRGTLFAALVILAVLGAVAYYMFLM